MTTELLKKIKESDIKLIRAIYAGPEGITRGKAFPPAFLSEVVEGGIGLTQAQASVTVLDQLPRESKFQPIGEVRICPDVETFQALPYLPGHARMLSDLETVDGEPWELCPRSLLKKQVGMLAERGIVLRASFENEFTVYENSTGAWLPIDQLNCFSSAAMDVASDFIIPTIAALEQQGVIVEKYFAEAGSGQQEMPVQHQEGVVAADQQVVFKETVRGVARAQGLQVSFMPKADPASAGNGCHIHMSLWDRESDRNLFYDESDDYELSETARQFTAGVLAHLPALLARNGAHNQFVQAVRRALLEFMLRLLGTG